MKKVCILILCLFSFAGIAAASNKYNSKLYLKVNGKKTTNIAAEKGKEVKVDVYFEAKKFDAYALLYTLKYDEKKLELVDVKGNNEFDVTSGKNILADRVEIPKKDNKNVMTLTFKAKSNDKSKIEFTDIAVANTTEQIELDNYKVSVNGSNIGIIACCAAGVIVIAGAAIIISKKKKK